MTVTAQTDRLILRPFTEADGEALHRIIGDAEVRKYIPAGPSPNMEKTLKFIDVVNKWEIAWGYTLWAVERKEDRALLGFCGLCHVEGDPAKPVEIAYTYGKEFWGQGYGAEAAALCVSLAFERYNLNELIALTHPENIASRRVLEKIGMQPDGDVQYYGWELNRFRLPNSNPKITETKGS